MGDLRTSHDNNAGGFQGRGGIASAAAWSGAGDLEYLIADRSEAWQVKATAGVKTGANSNQLTKTGLTSNGSCMLSVR